MKIEYTKVSMPEFDCSHQPLVVSSKTIEERKEKVLKAMALRQLDCLIVYADLEHGSNFEYLVGFLPRFEEALLVLHREGPAYLLLGNENLNKAAKARIPAEAIHVPYFSLPNQPMANEEPLEAVFAKAGIKEETKVGLAGWKLFTGKYSNEQTYDLPSYIVEALKKLNCSLCNATDIFIGEKGARLTNNAEEVASFEYFSSLASDCMLKAMEKVEEGVTELELGNLLNADGQRNSVVTIAAGGERFVDGNFYPLNRPLAYGDKLSLSVGYRGGLSSRSGYVARLKDGIREDAQAYLDRLVIPYYKMLVAWLEEVHCGMRGGELYSLIEEVFPKQQFHWTLNPGHLTAYEEWLASPVYPDSKEILESGMLFQTDIIPSVSGFNGTGAESTVLLADEKLQKEIKEHNPELYERFMKRRKYLEEELNIKLNPDLLPMASSLAYLRPFFLDKGYALKKLND